ncbi:MAG TPA: PAS domain S-box protein [Bdellovibrionota bacterium]|nr:PAS domain S-box protein [Bdellovibrionota bacterium]
MNKFINVLLSPGSPFEKEHYRALIKTVNEAMIVANREGNIVGWNPAAEQIFQYREEEVLNRPLTILMPAPYRNLHEVGMERFRQTGKGKVLRKILELAGIRKDGTEFPIELSISCFNVGKETFFCGIIRDVTKRKLFEEGLKRTQDLLQQAQHIDPIKPGMKKGD